MIHGGLLGLWVLLAGKGDSDHWVSQSLAAPLGFLGVPGSAEKSPNSKMSPLENPEPNTRDR